jgi:hypothetical protein
MLDHAARKAEADRLRRFNHPVWRIKGEIVAGSYPLYPIELQDHNAAALGFNQACEWLRRAIRCHQQRDHWGIAWMRADALADVRHNAARARDTLLHARRIRRHLILGLPPE